MKSMGRVTLGNEQASHRDVQPIAFFSARRYLVCDGFSNLRPIGHVMAVGSVRSGAIVRDGRRRGQLIRRAGNMLTSRPQ